MSIVMYVCKCPKEDLWETVKTIRKAYRDDNIYVDAIQKPDIVLREVRELEKWMVEYDDDVSLQLFDFDPFYIFRMIGVGFWLMNNAKKLGIETVSYDNRTDIPDEDLGNDVYVEPIDHMIAHQEYLEVHIFGHKDFFNIWRESHDQPD